MNLAYFSSLVILLSSMLRKKLFTSSSDRTSAGSVKVFIFFSRLTEPELINELKLVLEGSIVYQSVFAFLG